MTFHPITTSSHDLGGVDRVSRLGYGAMQLAGPRVLGLPQDTAGAIEVVQRAVAEGVTFIDTANAYGPRTVNQIIGRALSPYRSEVIIGNKVGAWRDRDGGWIVDSRPETIRTQVEDALTDLRAEVSPLTYLRLTGDNTGGGGTSHDVPLEDALGVLVELRDAGKIRHIGLSGASPELLERALAIAPVAAVQNRFNLIDRSGVGVLELCERHTIAFVPFFPLASGGLRDLSALDEPGRRLGVSTEAVALAWLLRRSPVVIPIPGTRSVPHLLDNLTATAVAERLTDDEITALTMVEDENDAHLQAMPARMAGALAQRASTR